MMHAAVWSQPTATNRKHTRTNNERTESPDSAAGKIVLGVGITQVLLGGLLLVLGLTGFFVRDDNKRYLGIAAVAGVVSVATGISGCRAVSGWERAKSCTNVFTIMSFLNTFSSLLITVMAVIILTSSPELLLTTVIAGSEAVLAGAGLALSLTGLIVAIAARTVLRNPLGGENEMRSTARKSRESH